jgi:predicted amino acid dehydrogenase
MGETRGEERGAKRERERHTERERERERERKVRMRNSLDSLDDQTRIYIYITNFDDNVRPFSPSLLPPSLSLSSTSPLRYSYSRRV